MQAQESCQSTSIYNLPRPPAFSFNYLPLPYYYYYCCCMSCVQAFQPSVMSFISPIDTWDYQPSFLIDLDNWRRFFNFEKQVNALESIQNCNYYAPSLCNIYWLWNTPTASLPTLPLFIPTQQPLPSSIRIIPNTNPFLTTH